MWAACVFGLAVLGWVAGCKPAPPPRDVLLITVDTLRPDFLSSYGFAQPSSPRVDALAAEGVVFDNALAAASLTAPAHASIMTSRFVRQHSIGPRNGETKLEGGVTLAEQFKAAGYQTAAFVSNVVLRRRIGLDRGFDVYDDELPTPELNRSAYFERTADATAERALEWIAQEHDGPIFVWLHIQDPHGPYTPPAEYAGRFSEVELRVKQPLHVLDRNAGRIGIPAYQALPGLERPGEYAARYAEEILFADHWIGEVVDAMGARDPGHDPVVLLTADHGESMGELGWFFQHGQSATPDLARVPFIVSAEGLEPRRESTWVSHVDVAPTLLELAGAGGIEDARGVSLVELLRGQGEVADRVLFCDTDGEAAAYTADGIARALGGPTFALPTPNAGALRIVGLYEKAPGVWRPAPVSDEAAEALEAYLGDATPLAPADDMAPEHIEQLRALGYLDPEPAAASEREDELGETAPVESEDALGETTPVEPEGVH
jgi:arylsulfatase A-like enzyme